uniref:Uncharacterized protein n=1 Tax=Marseillevirus LCMAC201 TaxID=2506605 RepID=A0A481YXN9_9VIRU|nr:MAG: hypothetical protein LCMAC201_05300 [Marseillevirus LCMAC201]
MSTAGFFQQNVDPNFRLWVSDENIRYIQREIARRMHEKYYENISVEYDRVRDMLIQTMGTWRGPLTLNELLEMVICDFVKDIDTDIEWRNRFNSYEPRTLYFPGTDLTREEKVKLNPGFKWEFQMNY